MRRTLMGLLGTAVLGLGILIVLSHIPVAESGQRSTAKAAGQADLTGIEIVRDTFGVPHIYAPTDEGALYGFGYAQAEDHLLDMLQNYLAVEGRMAEFFGEDFLEGDVQARAVLPYGDEDLLRRVDPETLRLVSAFARGVNRYIEDHRAELPEWAQGFEVTPAQPLRFAHFVMLSRALSVARQEFRQGSAPAVAQGPLEVLPFTEASNQWVVGSSRTNDGAPIFLMDPHLPWSGMNRWYEAHLVGETLDVYGATFYGSPFLAIGHNGKVAWSMTHNNPDLADVFVEELHPDDPRRYRTESGWAEMAVRKEVFRVKGRGPVTREIYYTRNGWVVSSEPERRRAVVVALEGLDLVDSPTQFLAMARARNIEEFKRAVAMHRLLLWNVMAADSQGHLYYVYNAHLHKRSERWGRSEWRPGWDPEARWQSEIYPFEELLRIEDPESDWMQNNNVMPWFVTSGPEMDPESFPSYLVLPRAGLNDRGRRASDVLSRAHDWTVSDALALATDTFVVAAEEALPQIFEAYEAAPPERRGALAPAIELLQRWNRRADVDQPGITLFYFWWHRPEGERERDPLKALEAAVSEMEGFYGTIEVSWGEIHRIRRGDLDLPIAGEQKPPTLWMASGRLDKRGKIYTDHGSSFTLLVKLGPRVEAYSLLPYGTSEDPASPHYADQVPLKSRGELKRAWFYHDEVLAHAERTYVLGSSAAQGVGPDPSLLGTVQRDVTYCVADGVELKMDMYYPDRAEGPLPVAMYVHGGGWRSGDKSGGAGMRDLPLLRGRGFLVVSINYRLAPRWRFPAMIEDVKCAVRSLRAHAEEWGLDPGRIGVWGGSAGGHLVALLGTLPEGVFEGSGGYPDYSSRVQAVVDLFGPTDLPRLLEEASPSQRRLIEEVFGTDDPNSSVLREASPVFWVSGDDPPFLILHGDRDSVVPLEQSQIFYERLREAGVPATLVVVKNAGHGFRPEGGTPEPSREELSRMIADFFETRLAR